MNLEFVTKEDLSLFRAQLISQIKTLLSGTLEAKKNPEFLRGHEVKKLMKVSTGTLQNLRIKRQLNPTKIGGILFYRLAEIEALLIPKKV